MFGFPRRSFPRVVIMIAQPAIRYSSYPCSISRIARWHPCQESLAFRTRFEALRWREAAHAAILYAFDLIEYDDEDLRNIPFLDRKAAPASLLRDIETGILLNEHVAADCPTVFAHACRLCAEGIVSKKFSTGPTRPADHETSATLVLVSSVPRSVLRWCD
jgi:hypothetical protein